MWVQLAIAVVMLIVSYAITASMMPKPQNAVAGKLDECHKVMAQVRRLDPKFRMADVASTTPLRRSEDLARYVRGLGLAGLPNCPGLQPMWSLRRPSIRIGGPRKPPLGARCSR